MRARASSTCWRSPSDSRPKARSAKRSPPNPASSNSAAARARSASVYSFHHVSSAAYRPVSTTSRAGWAGRSVRPTEALTTVMRRRSSRMSTRPRRSPRISTVPRVGHNPAPTTRRRVVLPDPLGPSSAHRSPEVDGPGDVVEQGHTVAHHGHAIEPDHRLPAHVPHRALDPLCPMAPSWQTGQVPPTRPRGLCLDPTDSRADRPMRPRRTGCQRDRPGSPRRRPCPHRYRKGPGTRWSDRRHQSDPLIRGPM